MTPRCVDAPGMPLGTSEKKGLRSGSGKSGGERAVGPRGKGARPTPNTSDRREHAALSQEAPKDEVAEVFATQPKNLSEAMLSFGEASGAEEADAGKLGRASAALSTSLLYALCIVQCQFAVRDHIVKFGPGPVADDPKRICQAGLSRTKHRLWQVQGFVSATSMDETQL